MNDLDKHLERMRQKLYEKQQRIVELKKSWPATKACTLHPESLCPLADDECFKASAAVYAPCPACQQARKVAEQNCQLHRAGVPSNLLHATLENWLPDDETETEHLAAVTDFARTRKGFLVMLGEVGTGKTHLAVGVMRAFVRPVLFRQNALLRALRQTYGNPYAEDPIAACQGADLFVLDEIGVSSGGRDEYPMIHEILDHRYAEFKPTVITGNGTVEQFREILGDRLVDRVRQAAFRGVLTFGGKSRRPGLREMYLHGRAAEIIDSEWRETL